MSELWILIPNICWFFSISLIFKWINLKMLHETTFLLDWHIVLGIFSQEGPELFSKRARLRRRNNGNSLLLYIRWLIRQHCAYLQWKSCMLLGYLFASTATLMCIHTLATYFDLPSAIRTMWKWYLKVMYTHFFSFFIFF